MFFKEQKYQNICYFYNIYLKRQSEERISEFIKNHNFKFFNQLKIPDLPENKYETYNMFYNLGTVSTPILVGDKKIDYAQKVVGFLLERFRKNELSMFELKKIFIYMNNDGFKPEFVEFFMSNYKSLLENEENSQSFISRCYNDFEKVQKTNTSNRGSQRQLKPTVEKFVDYFKKNKFASVNEYNKPISDAISPYFNKQKTFDMALKIDNERVKQKTPNHILKKPLTDYVPFETIDDLSEKINNEKSQIISNLLKTSGNEFSYEWLAKNDPENFILGKLCSCCANLEGVGYGIMRASIVDPFVQNLVIREKSGTIIAKSTLYINPIEKYGVFNNIEVNENVPDDKKQLIYDKYLDGVIAFINEYNKTYPERPLKQINVGMHLNDLETELRKNKKNAVKILKPIDYAKYGLEENSYAGDSLTEQYILWEKDPNENNTIYAENDQKEPEK